jgi:signal transduction histidine kinase
MHRRRQDLDTASRRSYARLRRRELLARLGFGASLGLVIVPLGALSNLLFLKDRIPERLAGFAFLLGVVCVALAARQRPWFKRNAEIYVVAYMTCVSAGLLYLLAQSPDDLVVLVAPVSSMVVAIPLMYPWGVRSQIWLAGFMTAGFSLLVWTLSPPGTSAGTFNFATALVTMSALSVLVTALLERHSFAAHVERRRVRALAIQRRRLMEIGRELRSTLDLEGLSPRLLAHALHVLPAANANMSRRDAEPGGDVFRIVASAGDPAFEEFVGLVWSPEFQAGLLARFPPKEVHVCPGSPIDDFVLPSLRQVGAKHVLMAVVGPPPEPLAFLTWIRREDSPFTRAECRTALEMADQAYTALSTAHLYGKALEASRLKSEFVSTMSHEFRTPLSVIVGYAEMARDSDLEYGERAQALAGIESSARELLLLVEQTLDIGRIEAGRSPVQLERVILPAFWGAMQGMCRLLPRKPEVRLVWGEHVPEIAIRSDRRRLAIMIRNLVGNALKFTEVGVVEATLTLEGPDLVVAVSDSGIGIRPEDREAIFEIFRQGDGSETRRYDGTGLGLYIVSQFAQQLGGTVAVSSEAGKGSCFVLRLPLRESASLAEGVAPGPPLSAPLAAVAAANG